MFYVQHYIILEP